MEQWLPLLHSGNQLDREGASQALGWLAKSDSDRNSAVPALIKALEDESMEVRRNASEALGRIGDPRALEPLNEMLEQSEHSWAVQVAKESIEIISEGIAEKEKEKPSPIE